MLTENFYFTMLLFSLYLCSNKCSLGERKRLLAKTLKNRLQIIYVANMII